MSTFLSLAQETELLYKIFHFLLIYFYPYIYPPNLQESDEGANT